MKARLHTGPALSRLATSTADISRYAPLRYQPVHENAEGWVVARPDDVAAALSSAALTVGTAGEPSGAAGRLQAQMARFSDGAAHLRRRALVQELLPDPAGLEQDARSMTSAGLVGRQGRWNAMELAKRVPCAVLAASLGVAAEAIGVAPEPADDGDAAATALQAALATPDGEERAVAAVSILFQARDATAGLIGLALSAATGHPQVTAADLVRLAERGDPPVQCTRRVAARPVTIGGVTIPAGALVWILLATADRGDPWPPATFGGGPHACPARLAATALARGVVGAILDGGWRPVPGQPVSYEPRPNLRIPVSVLLERS
jgi:cytochrome P450